MQAILMAGGEGTRLRPFTTILPKPLVPIGEISILEMVLRQLRHNGFKTIIIAVGYKAELIMAVIGDGNRLGLDITYHCENKPLGTFGALAEIENLEENFLVMNGDICTNLNFEDFYESHLKSGATATISTYNKHEKMELGVLTFDEKTQAIKSFQEKPSYVFSVSMGVNAFKRSIVDTIPKGKFFGFDDLMHKMLEKDIDVRAYQFDGLWNDIGRLDDYEKMLEQFKDDPTAYLPKGA